MSTPEPMRISSPQKETREFVHRGIVKYGLQFGDFTLAGGTKSDYYFDMREVITQMCYLDAIVVMFAHTLAKSGKEFQLIAGPAVGAIPLVVGLALYLRYTNTASWPDYLYTQSPKEHGTNDSIRGHIGTGDQVVLIEDVVTSGRSVLRTAAAVEAAGGHNVALLAILDREGEGEKEIAAAGIDYYPMFLASEFHEEITEGIARSRLRSFAALPADPVAG